ncbi:hypothetical protein [Caudovirales GX15bay]|nr:hypothetical protein [Caudovirales GX15bay]
MSSVVGGLLTRLVIDSLAAKVSDVLAGAGWFDPGRIHAPIGLIAEPVNWDVPVEPNTVVVSIRSVVTDEVELGSQLAMDRLLGFVDFYAQNDSLGIHLINDLRDGLRGRLVPNDANTFPILDFRLATPTAIGYATVVDAEVVREYRSSPEPWAAHIHRLALVVAHTYFGEPAT